MTLGVANTLSLVWCVSDDNGEEWGGFYSERFDEFLDILMFKYGSLP
jgi:hypothetical protein